MSLNEKFNKWKETTLKKSLDKFKERKERFETSAGIEVPGAALRRHPDLSRGAVAVDHDLAALRGLGKQRDVEHVAGLFGF